jgi:hypothetical protein
MSLELVQPINGSTSRGFSGSYSKSQYLVRAEPDWVAAFVGR